MYSLFIDKTNIELNNKYSDNENLLMEISAFGPQNFKFLNARLIRPFLPSYLLAT